MTRSILQPWDKCAFATVCFALVFLSMVFSPALLGQTASTGALTGTLRDSSGAVVPNATVTATSVDTAQARTTTTGADGTYKFTLLQPGGYGVKFEATGFSTEQVPSVTVTVTETAVLDQVLQVGSQTQQVEVRAEAQAVETASATQGTVLAGQTITDLPLTVRNYTSLLGLSAGAVSSVANAGALGRGTQEIAVNGSSVAQNDYSMDGVSVNNPSGSGTTADAGGSTGMGIVNPDAIQEFKIQTSLFDAGYGRNPGASVNVVTKSGTNQYHGSAFEFLRNTWLNANDFFRKMSPAVNGVPNNGRQVLNQNQYGGSFGGPVKKDKVFFFAAYQETWQKNGFSILASGNPTLVGIPQGDRSTVAFQQALGKTFCPGGSATIGGGNSVNGPSGGGTKVACDGSNINPVALNLLRLKNPDGSYFIPGSTTGVNQNAFFTSPALHKEHQAVGNLDYVIDSKNTVSGRWFITEVPQSVTFGCGVTGQVGTAILPCLPDDLGSIYYKNQYATVKLTTLLSNNWVNEARISFQQSNADLANTLPFSNTQAGITPIYPGFLFTPGNNPLGTIIVTGLFQLGSSLSLANTKHTGAWEVGDQLSWSHGRHTVRFGGEFERDRINWNLAGVNIINLTFATFQDFLLGLSGCAPGVPAAQCTASAASSGPGAVVNYQTQTNGTFVSNISSTGSTPGATYPGGLIHHFRNPAADLFIQDDFKVSNNLTLNLGLRWEYDSSEYDNQGQAVNLWPSLINTVALPGPTPATGTLAGFATPANYNPALNAAPPVSGIYQNNQQIVLNHHTPLDNFAPRAGVAWRPFSTDRFVVRSGAGYFYDRVGGLTYATAIVQSLPYSVTLGRSGTSTYFSTFQNPYPSVAPSWTPRWVSINPATQTGTSSNLAELFLDPSSTTPRVYEWNLDTQYEFLPRWVLEVAYVGSRGLHLTGTNRQYNEAQLVSPSNPYYGIVQNTTANASVRVPYLGFSPNGMTGSNTLGDSHFNSLQATVRKLFSHGLQLQAAYTWSRSVDTQEYFNIGDPDVGGRYGLATLYRPQRLAINYGWDLPFGHHDGFVGKVADGWNLSGVTVVQDGTPLTVTDSRGAAIYGFGVSGSPVISTAQYIGGAVGTSGSDEQRLGGWFNKTAFTPIPVIGSTPGVSGTGGTGYGNAGLGVILGPGQFNFDATLQKTTKVGGIHEDAALVFRVEFFNAFNHAQFNNPGTSGGATASSNNDAVSTFGQITASSVNPRLIQFALKYVF